MLVAIVDGGVLGAIFDGGAVLPGVANRVAKTQRGVAAATPGHPLATPLLSGGEGA